MTILDHITDQLEPFKAIVAKMGFETPTTDQRAEMTALIAKGLVIQEGVKKWARYRLADGAESKAPGFAGASTIAAGAKARGTPPAPSAAILGPARALTIDSDVLDQLMGSSVNTSIPDSQETEEFDFYELPEADRASPKELEQRWYWVEPGPYMFVQWPVQLNELHDYLESNWTTLVTKQGTILEVTAEVLPKLKGMKFKGVDLCGLSVANAIAELAQEGLIKVRRLMGVDRYGVYHQFGPWQ